MRSLKMSVSDILDEVSRRLNMPGMAVNIYQTGKRVVSAAVYSEV